MTLCHQKRHIVGDDGDFAANLPFKSQSNCFAASRKMGFNDMNFRARRTNACRSSRDRSTFSALGSATTMKKGR